MVNWRFKACPRCHGDLFIDSDIDGWYEQCLMCSFRKDLKDIADFQKSPALSSEYSDKKVAF